MSEHCLWCNSDHMEDEDHNIIDFCEYCGWRYGGILDKQAEKDGVYGIAQDGGGCYVKEN